MIYSISGKLIHKGQDCAVIECGGIGYKCNITFTTAAALAKAGENQTLYTQMYIRDDEVVLYGFAEMSELDCFKMLITVNGVGPKAALSILSVASPEKLALAIASEDEKTITAASGVGKKIAQRIILELRDRVKKLNYVSGSEGMLDAVNSTSTSAKVEAIAALEVLGYDRSAATMAIGKQSDELAVEELIKIGLKKLAGQ